MLSSMFQESPFLSRLLLSAAVTVGVFGLFELGLGFCGGEWSELYEGSPHTYWELRPNLDLNEVPHREEGTTFSVRTNDRGLRDGPMPSDSPWVLALGCSTTFGWGVEGAEAWPEVLERSLGVDVVNAGVPGHSSHQGLEIAPRLLKLRPRVAIFAWGLRDGNLVGRPDAASRAPQFPRNTRIFGWLKDMLPKPEREVGGVPRVGSASFGDNLRTLASMAVAQDTRVVLLDMTTTRSHANVLDEVGLPVVRPRLGSGHRFESDPVHFTVAGNAVIAAQIEGTVRAALSEEEPPRSVPPAPPQTP